MREGKIPDSSPSPKFPISPFGFCPYLVRCYNFSNIEGCFPLFLVRWSIAGGIWRTLELEKQKLAWAPGRDSEGMTWAGPGNQYFLKLPPELVMRGQDWEPLIYTECIFLLRMGCPPPWLLGHFLYLDLPWLSLTRSGTASPSLAQLS